MNRAPSPLALRAFEAAGRHLSFGKAARELHVTQSAISHQVRRLEDELGTPLFVRRTRAVELTPAGAGLLRELTDAFARIRAAIDRLRDQGATPLRVSLLASFATHWLVPRLSSFTRAHGDIELSLEPSIDLVRVGGEGPELAIRYGRGRWPEVKATRLMGERLVPVCSPAFRRAHGPFKRVADVMAQPLLNASSRNPFEWEDWCAAQGVSLTRAKHVRLTDYNIVVQAALDGQGIAMGRCAIIGELIRRKRLVEVLPGTAYRGDFGYWLVTSRAPLSAAARAFAQWLTAQARETDAVLRAMPD